jgi:hypothetical protein
MSLAADLGRVSVRPTRRLRHAVLAADTEVRAGTRSAVRQYTDHTDLRCVQLQLLRVAAEQVRQAHERVLARLIVVVRRLAQQLLRSAPRHVIKRVHGVALGEMPGQQGVRQQERPGRVAAWQP